MKLFLEVWHLETIESVTTGDFWIDAEGAATCSIVVCVGKLSSCEVRRIVTRRSTQVGRYCLV